MPTEGERVKGRKKILLPTGDTIYVPVITQISFIDPYERYQQTDHSIDNSEESNRNVHVDNVHPVPVDQDGVPISPTASTQDTTQSLFVERIDTWHAVDPYERYQQTDLTLDNTTGNDLLPPHFSNHEKTHIYRYHQDPENPDDDGVWVDSELIDEFTIIDPYERYQEKHYTLLNATNDEFRSGDLSGQASTDDPDITIGSGDGEGTEANPVRLDPFQNIVNYSGGLELEITFFWTDLNISSTFNGGDTAWLWTVPANLTITLNKPVPPDDIRIQLVSDDTTLGPYTYGQAGSNPTRQPAGWTSNSASNQFSRRILYKIPTLAKGETLTLIGSMTPVADYTSEIFTSGGLSRYQTATANNGPWPIVNIRIYRRKPTPENPTDVETLWQANTFQSSIFSGPALPLGNLVAWTNWYRTGIFKTGEFEIKLANVVDPADPTGDDELAAWVSKSIMRIVPDVDVVGNLMNYNLGIYHAFADWLGTGGEDYFPFGKSPIDANSYSASTGEAPEL